MCEALIEVCLKCFIFLVFNIIWALTGRECCNTAWKSPYFLKRFCVIIVNISILVIGLWLHLYFNHAYAIVLDNETQEWSQNPVSEIIKQAYPTACPSGQTQITGLFYGTEDQCINSDGVPVASPDASSCNDKTTGLSSQTIGIFGNGTICMKRSSGYNYHDIALTRQSNSKCTSSCGNSSYSDTYYCIFGNVKSCPINQITMIQSTNSSTWNLTSNKYSNINPIVNFHVSLSQPCGNTLQPYMQREIDINNFYKESTDECDFWQNGAQGHIGYLNSGYSSQEYDVYDQNSIISQLRKYQIFLKDDLTKNSFKLYYKPYAMWKKQCYQVYNTTEVVNKVDIINEAYDFTEIIYAITLLVFLFDIAYTLLQQCLYCRCGPWCLKCRTTFTLRIYQAIYLTLKIAMIVALLILYIMIKKKFENIDSDFIEYAISNQCSDELVNYSFQQVQDQHDQMIKTIKIGIAFTVVCIFFQVLFGILTWPFYDMFAFIFNRMRGRSNVGDQKLPQPQEVVDQYAVLNKNGKMENQTDRAEKYEVTDKGPVTGNVFVPAQESPNLEREQEVDDDEDECDVDENNQENAVYTFEIKLKEKQ